jgi:hypothetical protein
MLSFLSKRKGLSNKENASNQQFDLVSTTRCEKQVIDLGSIKVWR